MNQIRECDLFTTSEQEFLLNVNRKQLLEAQKELQVQRLQRAQEYYGLKRLTPTGNFN